MMGILDQVTLAVFIRTILWTIFVFIPLALAAGAGQATETEDTTINAMMAIGLQIILIALIYNLGLNNGCINVSRWM